MSNTPEKFERYTRPSLLQSQEIFPHLNEEALVLCISTVPCALVLCISTVPCHFSFSTMYRYETISPHWCIKIKPCYTTPHDNTTPGFSCMSADIQEKEKNSNVATKTCILKGHQQNPSEPQNNFHCNLYTNTQLYTLR